MVRILLRLEGLAILIASVYLYSLTEASWLLFALLLFTPDLSMIGYLKDKKIGATIYNLVHNVALGVLVIFLGVLMNIPVLIPIGLILAAHVGMDRAMGYGLKYPTSFKDTHMQKV